MYCRAMQKMTPYFDIHLTSVAWEAILKKTTINKTYWEWKLYYLSDNGRQSRLGNCRPSTALFSLIPPSAKARVQQLCYGRKG